MGPTLSGIGFTQRKLWIWDPVRQDYGHESLTTGDVRVGAYSPRQSHYGVAEQYLAGSAFCRIRVPDVKSLYDEYRAAGVMHPHGPFRQ